MSRGVFITFEGPEGGGKTTQLELLYRRLAELGIRVRRTREPGGTATGERIRSILLDPTHSELSLRAEVLLFAASRAQHVEELLYPALVAGEVVLCDRYVDATFAYQGYAGGTDLAWLEQLTRYATGGLMPDLTILLDVPPELGLRRKRADHHTGSGELNRIDRRELEYHQAVRQGFLARAAVDPARFLVADASRPTAEVTNAIRDRVERLLRARGLVPRLGTETGD